MSLKMEIANDLKNAMKAKEVLKRDVLRFLMSSFKQVEVDERRELSDDDVIKLVQKSIKQREDSITQYKSAGRDDLVQKEQSELEIIKVYLPKQLSNDELEEAIKEIIAETNATSLKDIGKIMGIAVNKLSKVADGRRINEISRQLLS